jgi:hypothetical protein
MLEGPGGLRTHPVGDDRGLRPKYNYDFCGGDCLFSNSIKMAATSDLAVPPD